jgi:hypothetical protein
MIFLCRCLLYLYPAGHRAEFGEEMLRVLRERQQESRKKAVVARGVLYGLEIGGLLRGAVEEHCRVRRSFYPWGVIQVRRMSLRSEFRFPKATAVLMTVILAAVVMAIEKARAIQFSVPEAHRQVGPIRSADFTVVPSFALLLVIACAAGAIGWAVVFAMKRSGVQRLEGLRGSGEQLEQRFAEKR